MNPIKNIEIKNFKSIRHLKIEDCRRINVFVGYPNVGKSNILEALAIFGVNEFTNSLKKLVRLKELPTIFFNGYVNNDFLVAINDNIGVVGYFAENNFILQYQDSGENGGLPGTRLNIALNSAVQETFVYKSNFEYSGSQVPNNRSFGRRIVTKKYAFDRATKYTSGDYSHLSFPFGENIFPILQTNEELNRDAKELFEEYGLEFLYDSREQEFTILKRTNSGIFTVPYELVADTLQRLIFYKAAIASNKEAILLFEEPEAHMFPPYISKFSADVMYDKNDNQYFINTHSPFVINDLMENLKKEELCIYVVGYKKETGETVLRKLTDKELHEIYQYGIDLYLNLENFLLHEQ